MVAGLFDGQHTILADDAAAGAAFDIAILDDEGFCATGLYPDTKAAQFSIPDESLVLGIGLLGVDCPLG